MVLLVAGYFGVFPIRGPDLDLDLASGENSPFKLPDKPSIAVLPFTNMSGDPEQEYFADGITEDIITELSKFHQLFVIARNSSFNFKGKPADSREVARQLGVRYVLKGTIRRSKETLRITAQLIDADTGTNLWAKRYDRPLSEIGSSTFQMESKRFPMGAAIR